MLNKLKRILKVVMSFVPQQLPQSEYAVLRLCKEVTELGNLPNNDSFTQAIASSVMHLSQDATTLTKRRVLNGLRRSIANQASYNIMAMVKENQIAQQKQAQEAATASNAETV